MQNGQFEAEILMRVGHRLIALSRVINEDEGRTTLSNSEQFKVGGKLSFSLLVLLLWILSGVGHSHQVCHG